MSKVNDDWMNRIEGLNTDDGIRYTGSAQEYLKFLKTFLKTLEDKASEIEDSYKNGTLELCTIKVHALKSTARIIGAKELSRMAEMMETAGKSGDMKTFDANIEGLLELYRSYKDKLGSLPEEESIIQRDPISEDALEEAYEALRCFVSQMDYDAVSMILDEMKMYQLPDKDQKIFDDLGAKIMNYDWEGMENLLQ